MELREVIENRSSVRRFKDEKVNIEDIKEMIRLANLAPSINNAQIIEYIAITNKVLVKKMGELVHLKIQDLFGEIPDPGNIISKVEKFSTFFEEAPALIVVLNKPYTALIDNLLDETTLSHEDINSMRNFPNIQSLGAAIQNLLLSAVDFGYGACWLTAPLIAKEKLEELLEIKKPFSIAAMVVLGVPADKSQIRKEKKNLDEILKIIE